jgi:hypothetical protein
MVDRSQPGKVTTYIDPSVTSIFRILCSYIGIHPVKELLSISQPTVYTGPRSPTSSVSTLALIGYSYLPQTYSRPPSPITAHFPNWDHFHPKEESTTLLKNGGSNLPNYTVS